MGQISSINFKKSTSFQVFHNSTIRPSYAIGGDLECTLKGYEAKNLKEQIIQRAKENYAKHCKAKNKAFQATNYEWSAVCNIKPDSTMADLENLTAHFKEKYGFQCYQIAIHRDEGYIDEQGKKHLNHHAHLEFITLDENTGKQCFKMRDFPPQKMREIQSEVAEILQMKRGIDKRLTNAKRIEPRVYAKMKEYSKAELRIENTKNKDLQAELDKEKAKNQKLEQEILTQKQIKERLEKERKAWIVEGGHTKEDYAELRKLKEQAYAKIEDLEKKISLLNEEIIKNRTELALESKNKDEVIQNLENENKVLKIENTQRFSLKQVREIVSTFDFLEMKRMDIELYIRCNKVNSVDNTSTELENFLNKNKNLGLEKFFNLEPYVEICKKAKQWIQEKKLNLTRDRGISR